MKKEYEMARTIGDIDWDDLSLEDTRNMIDECFASGVKLLDEGGCNIATKIKYAKLIEYVHKEKGVPLDAVDYHLNSVAKVLHCKGYNEACKKVIEILQREQHQHVHA